MRSPEELDEVDWTDYEHGKVVPPLIRMLYRNRSHFDVDEYCELESLIYNVGTVYRATVPAVPFLAHAALHSECFPGIALNLLSRFTDRTDDADGLELEVRDAVVAQAPGLLPCLEFRDPKLRRLALHVFGGCGRFLGAERPLVTSAVRDVFNREMDRDVAADALTALETLEDDAEFASLLEHALSEPDPVIRLTGLLCALEVGYVRSIDEQAEFVVEAGSLAARFDWSGISTPFPVLGSGTQRARRQFDVLQRASRDRM